MGLYKIIENKKDKRWEVRSIFGELIASFDNKLQALQYKINLDTNHYGHRYQR